MVHFPRLVTALLILLLLAGTAVVAATPPATHSVYLPWISSPLEHGGPHSWPRVTITPTPEASP